MSEKTEAETPNTLDSYDEMSEKLTLKTQGRKIRNRFLLSLSLLLALFLVFYFTLPVFQASQIHADGLHYLSQEDFRTLAELDSYAPLVFFTGEENQKKAKENSKNLIYSLTFQNNGFSCKAKVIENSPKAKYHNTLYMMDGNSYPDVYSGIDRLPLGIRSLHAIQDKMKADADKSYPELHLPEGISLDENNAKAALSSLAHIPSDWLSNFEDIGFINSLDSKWNNVVDILIHADSYDFLLHQALVSELPSIFPSERKEEVLKECINAVPQMETSEFSFSDEPEKVHSVYVVKAIVQNGLVKIMKGSL